MNNKIIIFIIILIILLLIICNIDIIFEKFSNSYTLPKIAWSYWDTDNYEDIPLVIRQIVNDRNKKLESKNWEVIFLNNLNINEYIHKNEYPPKYRSLTIQAQSDWIRLKLLQKYGGLWIDAGVIINDIDAFDKLYQDSIIQKSDLTAFYIKKLLTNDDPTTFIESWYLLSPVNNKLIDNWLQEFEHAIDIGFNTYRDNFVDSGYENWGILKFGIYLMIHLCSQMALKNVQKIYTPNLLLYNAEDTMLSIQESCTWDKTCIQNMLQNKNEIKKIPYIKLRGDDRINDMQSYFEN